MTGPLRGPGTPQEEQEWNASASNGPGSGGTAGRVRSFRSTRETQRSFAPRHSAVPPIPRGGDEKEEMLVKRAVLVAAIRDAVPGFVDARLAKANQKANDATPSKILQWPYSLIFG